MAVDSIQEEEEEEAVESYGEGKAVDPDDVLWATIWNLRPLSLCTVRINEGEQRVTKKHAL